jgi:hypothetical protein
MLTGLNPRTQRRLGLAVRVDLRDEDDETGGREPALSVTIVSNAGSTIGRTGAARKRSDQDDA